MKISFDFDNTLQKSEIQGIAKEFVNKGHDVYITTQRFKISPFFNLDVYRVAQSVGIPANKIRFTNTRDKFNYLKDFDIHFDDKESQIELINRYTNCVGILVE